MTIVQDTQPFGPKDPSAEMDYSLDFGTIPLTPSTNLVSAESTIEQVEGTVTDNNVPAILIGSVIITGTIVTQRLGFGLPGNTYKWKCEATADDGQIYVLAGLLPVEFA